MLSKFDKYVNLIKDTKDEKDYSIYTQIIKNERIRFINFNLVWGEEKVRWKSYLFDLL